MFDNERYDLEIKKRLTPSRYQHSINVAQTARLLAERFGGDCERAYTAGLLHDILKDTPSAELSKLMAEYFPLATPLERGAKKLWHAMAGSEFVRRELKLEDEAIITAIRYHTTGRAGMSLLEKIVFVADFISADRCYDGVERMRLKAAEDLSLAMEEGLQFTIIELCRGLHAVHPDTLSAYNEIVL